MDEIVRSLFFSPLLQGLFLLLSFLYVLMILWLRHGWRRLRPFEESCREPRERVTVIVPCRNEEDHLPALAEALAAQSYPAALTEILFVDDHSTDNTRTVMKLLAGRHGNIRVLHSKGHGKKEALLTALEHCTTDWVFTTDADGRPEREWIAVMMAYQRKTAARFLAGPVEVLPGKDLFSLFRALEFYSLTGAGQGAAGNGHPLYCNGVNMAYHREVTTLEGDPFRKDLASGDDVFLLHTVKRKMPERMAFLKSRRAAVKIREEGGAASFFRQRRRWASKGTAYRDRDTLVTAWLVFLVNAALVFTFAGGVLRHAWWLWSGILWCLKSVPDVFFLREILAFYGRERLLRLFPAAQLLYPFYIVVTALAGIFSFPSRQKGW